MSRGTLRDLPTSVKLQSCDLSPNQHPVSPAMLNASPHLIQEENYPQGYCGIPIPLSQNVVLSSSIARPLSVETLSKLPCKPGDMTKEGQTSATEDSCGSFHISNTIPHKHHSTHETTFSNATPRFRQAEAMQGIPQAEDLVDPSVQQQDDIETCNDSSSNNESDESGKDPASKSSSDGQQPPCNSNAFSLMMADSEQNPSSSGYSSEQPAKAKTQKELMKILKEIRSFLPPEKRCRGKYSTAASLHYALQCIQQVKASEEYYQLLMVNDKHPCNQDLPCYTVPEIANITSEFTKNNMDVFAVTVSLVTGRILYISEQASLVLRCSADLFSQVRFVELLAPQDVPVFYSSITPHRLPSWNICNGTGYLDGLEEKSFYCRISCGRETRREVSYYPFRLTPYLIHVQVEESTPEQQCCVLFAERVHSGYEAPRIPADKRIFTTTHTPTCLFQDVDDRAVPLLGYLPQDLIGSPIILHLHPSDRSLMLAVHKKILQYGGQPFDFSPIRFCARNGEYITMDTSWSSFINPWSRKVSFIIGRHKVRMGPVNEDIFTAPPCLEDRSLQPGIQELSEQIHQLLMQPVHNSSSSGYGSLGSNGSHENPLSGASSSDSNGNLNEDVKEKQSTVPAHGLKADLGSSSLDIKEQQNLESSPEAALASNENEKDIIHEGSKVDPCSQLPVKQPYSYQQISSLDSVIRYLESCSVLVSEKCRFVSSDKTASSAFDDVQMQDHGDTREGQTGSAAGSVAQSFTGVPSSAPISGPDTTCQSVPGSLRHSPPPSVPVPGTVITQLSMAAKAESVASLTSHCSYSSTIVHVGDKKLLPETELEDGPSTDVPAAVNTQKEPYKQPGLTKKVLVAHTHKEENDFLNGFMDVKRLSAFQTRCNSYMHERTGALQSNTPKGADATVRRNGKGRRPKVKRTRPESWDSSSSGVPQAHRCPLPGLNTTAWSQSDNSHASYPPLPYPLLPAYPFPVFPPPQIPVPNETPHGPLSNMQPFPTPLVPPMVALVLPNYMYPSALPPTVYSGASPQQPFPVQPALYTPPSNPTFSVPHAPFSVPQPVAALPMQNPGSVPPFSYATPTTELRMREEISRPSSPQGPQSPPLFQSRCSSPLQLNLLQLEESIKAERSEGGTCGGGAVTGAFIHQCCEDPQLHTESPADDHTSDAVSTGSDLMDLLLQEDASSGTCSTSSVISESLTSGFRANGTSGSQTGSSQTSHSSKYFGSVDSSENNQKESGSTPSCPGAAMKYVLQDPMWLLMANADENVMLTYQISSREIDQVLREDRDRLKSMQKFQPRFTDDQWKELGEIHSWIQRGGFPGAIEVTSCVFCKGRGSDCAEYAETIQDLELSGIMESFD